MQKKRILSFLLACLMVLTALPAAALSVFALDTALTEEDLKTSGGNWDYSALYVKEGLALLVDFSDATAGETDLTQYIRYRESDKVTLSKVKNAAVADGYYDLSQSVDDMLQINHQIGTADLTLSLITSFAQQPSGKNLNQNISIDVLRASAGIKPGTTALTVDALSHVWTLRTNNYATNSDSYYVQNLMPGAARSSLDGTKSVSKTYSDIGADQAVTLTYIADKTQSDTPQNILEYLDSLGLVNSAVLAKTEAEYPENAAWVRAQTYTGLADMRLYVNDDLHTDLHSVYYKEEEGVYLGASALMKLYGVALYRRALTLPELQQNHFADLCRMAGYDLTLFVTLSAEQQQSVFEALWTTPVSASPADISFAINTAIYGEVLGGVASEDALALLVRYNVNFAALEAIDDLQVRTFAYADFGQYTAFANDAEAQSVFDAIVAFWQALDFEGFRAMDQQSQLYAIGPVSSLRMKDYSDAEAAQTYLDSLVSAFTMDLTRYDNLPDAYRALVDRSVSFDVASIMASSDPRAAAQAAFDSAISAAVNDYDALYTAQNSLIVWVDFRDAAAADAISSIGDFVKINTVGTQVTTSVSGSDAAAVFGDGFLDLPSSTSTLNLSGSFLNQKSYTVSLITAMEDQTSNGGEAFYCGGVRGSFDGRFGHLTVKSLRSSWIFYATGGVYTRTYPTAMISTEGETVNAQKEYNSIPNGQLFNYTMTVGYHPTSTKMADYLATNPGSFVFDQAAYDNATFSDKSKVYDGLGDFAVRIDGDTAISLNQAYYNNEQIRIGYSTLMKIYQMRIYNRVLTVEEQAQNQFADLASYYGLDLSQYIYLSGTVRSEFLTYMFEEANYGMTREAVQNMMDAKIDALLDALYAGIRVPDTDENAAVLNHFADLAQALRLNIGSYAMMSLPLRLAVATCFAGDELANLSYRTAQPRLTRAIEDALLSALLPDNLFTFVGWSYRMREGYGLRTYFDFDASTIAGLEENGYTVRVGILRLTNPMLTDSDYSKLFSLSGGVLTPVDGATIAYLYDATHALPEEDKSGLVLLCHEQTYAETATGFSAQQLYIAFIAAIGEGG